MKILIILSVLFTIACAQQNNHNSAGRQGRSPCQEHRERELANSRQSGQILIPECDENGDYMGKQCHPPATDGKRFCQCWAPNGDILSSPSKNTETCKCHTERFKTLNPTGSNSVGGSQRRAIGQFVPECEPNGKFKKQQCHGSTGHCWCANQMTGEQIGERQRGSVSCN